MVPFLSFPRLLGYTAFVAGVAKTVVASYHFCECWVPHSSPGFGLEWDTQYPTRSSLPIHRTISKQSLTCLPAYPRLTLDHDRRNHIPLSRDRKAWRRGNGRGLQGRGHPPGAVRGAQISA